MISCYLPRQNSLGCRSRSVYACGLMLLVMLLARRVSFRSPGVALRAGNLLSDKHGSHC